jgi:hypothetical protein
MAISWPRNRVDSVAMHACGVKRPYSTLEAAEERIPEAPVPLYCYRCPFGDHWHLTKRRGTA